MKLTQVIALNLRQIQDLVLCLQLQFFETNDNIFRQFLSFFILLLLRFYIIFIQSNNKKLYE
jgi:hypothetical protein